VNPRLDVRQSANRVGAGATGLLSRRDGTRVVRCLVMRAALLLLLSCVLVACVGDPVGDPCVPEQVPEGGFASTETYVELSSAECATRVCLVRHLSGDPTPSCTTNCATEQEVEESVYCSCRCDGAGACECPAGFACTAVGAESYCVRE
jgi:hypothetical protein